MKPRELFKYHSHSLGYLRYRMECDGFYVSYVIDCSNGEDETAIIHNDESHVLIGDHRDEYADLNGQALEAFIKYFQSGKDAFRHWASRD